MTKGGKKGYMDAKWTTQCGTLMEQDSRFLLECDKLQAGVELAFGDKRYLLNPFQLICPICGEVKWLGNMNQPVALIQHISNQHQTDSAMACNKRLKAWGNNHFISGVEMDREALLPDGLFNPTILLSTPRVRNAILTRDIA